MSTTIGAGSWRFFDVSFTLLHWFYSLADVATHEVIQGEILIVSWADDGDLAGLSTHKGIHTERNLLYAMTRVHFTVQDSQDTRTNRVGITSTTGNNVQIQNHVMFYVF